MGPGRSCQLEGLISHSYALDPRTLNSSGCVRPRFLFLEASLQTFGVALPTCGLSSGPVQLRTAGAVSVFSVFKVLAL